MVSVRESSVERRLDVLARRHGGLTVKLAAGGAGMPDRLVVLPGGRVWFVEVKRPGGRARVLQEAMLERLRSLSVPALVVDDADGFFRSLE